MSFKRNIKILGPALLAALALSAVVAGAAQAAGGPEWIVKCHKVLPANVGKSRYEDAACTKLKAGGGFDTRLYPGEKETISSKDFTTFKLEGTTNIKCKHEKDTGEIFGGNPGTDETTIHFEECAVEGKSVAECGASNTATAGEVLVSGIKTVLVYPNEKAENTEEALDAFIPGGTGNLFVEFELKGTNCALLNKLKVRVNATGTEIKEPAFNKKCGVLTEVGKIAGGSFMLTKSGELVAAGALRARSKAEGLITKAELWKPGAGKFEKIECKLEAFNAEAAEAGISEVKAGLGLIGWEI